MHPRRDGRRVPLLTERVAEALWVGVQADLATRPTSPRPTLVMMSGVPLSGKSTLARALAARAATRTLLVENDAIRARIAERLRIPRPTYEGRKSFFTYRVVAARAPRAEGGRERAA